MKYENTELLNHSIADDFDTDEAFDRQLLSKMFNPLNMKGQQAQNTNMPIVNNSFNGFTMNVHDNHMLSHNSGLFNANVLKNFENIHPTGLISTPIVTKKASELFD
ncbi:MAG: hypothetical protein ACRCTZ_07290 [Sarcina sp.]